MADNASNDNPLAGVDLVNGRSVTSQGFNLLESGAKFVKGFFPKAAAHHADEAVAAAASMNIVERGAHAITKRFGGEITEEMATSVAGKAAKVAKAATVFAAVAEGAWESKQRVDEYHGRQDKLAAAYSGEVGELLGKPAKEVTLDDLKQVAKGDAKKGVPGNPAIANALEMNGHKMRTDVVSTFGGTTGGALAGAAIGSAIPVAGTVAGFVVGAGVGLAVTWASQRVTGAVGEAIGEKIKSAGGTAHEQIGALNAKRHGGADVSAADVQNVLFARDTLAGAKLAEVYSRGDDKHFTFSALSPETQAQWSQGTFSQAQAQGLADDINAGRMNPERLAFISSGQLPAEAPAYAAARQAVASGMTNEGEAARNAFVPDTTPSLPAQEQGRG